jgi:hypothetical protein
MALDGKNYPKQPNCPWSMLHVKVPEKIRLFFSTFFYGRLEMGLQLCFGKITGFKGKIFDS